MDAIQTIATPLPAPSRPAPAPKQQAEPVLPTPRRMEQQAPTDAQVQEKRQAALKEAAAQAFVLGDQRFTIFKDSTGQYITRFTSLRDGRVTYIPEPQLLAMSNGSNHAPVVDLNA